MTGQLYLKGSKTSHFSPVHVVLVSLLVNQLSGLFLIFFGRPKKIVQSQGIFGQSLIFFGQPCLKFGHSLISEGDQFSNKAEQKNQSLTKKNQRLTKNSLRLDNFFLVNQKK